MTCEEEKEWTWGDPCPNCGSTLVSTCHCCEMPWCPFCDRHIEVKRPVPLPPIPSYSIPSPFTSYDLKIYEGNEEMETIRGLSQSQIDTIVAVLNRHEIRHLVKRV